MTDTGTTPARRQLSLCHLIATNFAGGPEKQILQLTSRLEGAGWRVAIGSFLEGRDHVEIVQLAQARGLDTFLIETAMPFDPRAIGQVRAALRERKADVLVTHGYKANLVGWFAVNGTRTVQLPTVRGYTGEDAKVRVYEWIDRQVLKRCDRMLAVSQATRNMLIGHGIRPEAVEVLHNAVDDRPETSPVDLAREFNFPADARILVSAGRLSPEKGQKYLVEAMQIVREQDPGIRAIMFGSGRDQEQLEAQIGALGLDGVVVFGGFRKDVLSCLAAADLVVNPSLTEGLPNVVLEAMSVGTAVVATEVGGVNELIRSGESGWLVGAGDARALAQAILDAFHDDGSRAAVADAALRTVSGSFSFDGQADRFMRYCAGLPLVDPGPFSAA